MQIPKSKIATYSKFELSFYVLHYRISTLSSLLYYFPALYSSRCSPVGTVIAASFHFFQAFIRHPFVAIHSAMKSSAGSSLRQILSRHFCARDSASQPLCSCQLQLHQDMTVHQLVPTEHFSVLKSLQTGLCRAKRRCFGNTSLVVKTARHEMDVKGVNVSRILVAYSPELALNYLFRGSWDKKAQTKISLF